MWAIRKASLRINSQPFSSVLLCARYAKVERASSIYTNTGFCVPPSNLSDDSFGLLKRLSWDNGTQPLFMSIRSFSSQSGTKTDGEENDDFKDNLQNVESASDDELVFEDELSESENELDLLDTKEIVTKTSGEENDDCKDNLQNVENASDDELVFEDELSESEKELDLLYTKEVVAGDSNAGTRASSELFKVVVNSPLKSVQKALSKWVEEGGDLCMSEISHLMFELRRQRMYGKALKLSEWLEAEGKVEFGGKDYASRVDLISKVKGFQKAEAYIKKIPKSFRRELVYETLLANCVSRTLVTKAEQIFYKEMLHCAMYASACNQMLLLYARIDMRKIHDVLSYMEEFIEPSLSTYRIWIQAKGQCNDFPGIEKVLQMMKNSRLEPDLRLQAELARQYIHGGNKEKARVILKDMEGSNLNENRRACSSLLLNYALLESYDDVRRVWEVCGSNPRLDECMKAIEAFGKLKKVEEAEAVFDQMSEKLETLSAKHYASLLNVYADNKMITKGKDLVKRMSDSGCRIGPLTLDALVKLYVESGEIEKAISVFSKALQLIEAKPLFNTYMTILNQYAKRGDVHNAEKIFLKMRQDGYFISRRRQYKSLLQAYINGKVPAYGLKERLKGDGVISSKSFAAQLVKVDAFRKSEVHI